MAVELIAYAAPLADGAALAAPAGSVAAMEAAGRVLAVRPQVVELCVLVPAGDGLDAASREVRSFFRRAATHGVLPRASHSPGPSGRWHAALLACGWLLLVGGGGSAAAVGGLWLAVAYPLLRRAVRRSELASFAQPAAQLAYALGAAPVVTREHAGLTELGRVVRAADGAPAQRYRRAAATCAAVGLSPLAELYEALARGTQPPMAWGVLARSGPGAASTGDAHAETPHAAPVEEHAKEESDGAVRQPA